MENKKPRLLNIEIVMAYSYTTPAQINAFADAFFDRIAFAQGRAPEMHLIEPVRQRRSPLAPSTIPAPPVERRRRPRVVLGQDAPPVAYLDLGGWLSPR